MAILPNWMDTIIKRTDDLIGEFYKKHYKKNKLLFFQMYFFAFLRKLKSVSLPTDIKRKPRRKSTYATFGLAKILNNFSLYEEMASKSGISIYNLSKNSNLNKVPTFNYLNPNEIFNIINKYKS